MQGKTLAPLQKPHCRQRTVQLDSGFLHTASLTLPTPSRSDAHSNPGEPPVVSGNEPGEFEATAAPAKRVLIIGLDGATFDVLVPLMEAGRMPRLKEAVTSGASGLLRSTMPPLTPAAWTTFLTGRQPGAHGIIDFEQYDVFTNRFVMNSARCGDRVPSIWQILGDQGLKVGSVNVPMTYPPMKVNGFMVSGFETPGPESDFIYPAELKPDILARWPDPTFGKNWRKKRFGGLKLFRENVEYLSRSFHQGAAMTMWLGDRFGWDVLMVVLKLVDNLQHKTWKYLDPRFEHRDGARREIVADAFHELDRATGTLLDYAAANDASALIVSDHGHGSLEGKVHPNALLKRWGYLSLAAGAERKDNTKRDRHIGDVERALPVDYANTRAAVMHAGNAGFLYINLKGRQPTGIVEPADYEALRDELIARLQSDGCTIRNPEGMQIPLFPEVHRPEVVYGCRRKDQPWLPDLILIPHETLSVVRRLRGRTIVKWFPYRRMEGTHRHDGIFIATGPGIRVDRDVRAHLVDCAPTILTMLGLAVPDEMQGRVVAEIFATPPVIKTTSATPRSAPSEQVLPSSAHAAAQEPVYSEDELAKVTERLSDLGYLE